MKAWAWLCSLQRLPGRVPPASTCCWRLQASLACGRITAVSAPPSHGFSVSVSNLSLIFSYEDSSHWMWGHPDPGTPQAPGLITSVKTLDLLLTG